MSEATELTAGEEGIWGYAVTSTGEENFEMTSCNPQPHL